MGRTRVLRRELERPEGPRLARLKKPGAERSDDVGPIARELLRLQRSSGNGAVESMLAQRDGPAERDGGKDEAVTATLVVDDPIGVLPLISFSRESERSTSVVVPSSAKDPVLMEACAKGKHIGTVKISTARLTITLDDVLISGCQSSSSNDRPVLNLTLDTPPPDKKS